METATAPIQENSTAHAASPSPALIMQIGTGFWASKILLTAVTAELFTHLAAKGSMTVPQIKQTLGWGCTDRHAVDFLDTLTHFGFLERKGLFTDAVYSNGADASAFLDKKKPTYIGGIL